jgi:hypothetical protein
MHKPSSLEMLLVGVASVATFVLFNLVVAHRSIVNFWLMLSGLLAIIIFSLILCRRQARDSFITVMASFVALAGVGITFVDSPTVRTTILGVCLGILAAAMLLLTSNRQQAVMTVAAVFVVRVAIGIVVALIRMLQSLLA